MSVNPSFLAFKTVTRERMESGRCPAGCVEILRSAGKIFKGGKMQVTLRLAFGKRLEQPPDQCIGMFVLGSKETDDLGLG